MKLKVDGREVFATTGGTDFDAAKPAVVFLHGAGFDRTAWRLQTRWFAHHGRSVLAVDFPAHGWSAGPMLASVGAMADWTAHLIAAAGLTNAALVGHSMGALAVLRYLQDHGTGRVAAVTLVDQSPRIVTDDSWRLGMFGGCSAPMLLGLIAGARRNLVDTVLHEVEGASGAWLRRRLAADAALGRQLRRWLGHVDVSALLDLAESLALADFRPLLPRLDVPLCVVLGARSAHYRGLPLDAYYREAVPHATVSIYERAGHSPHVSEPGRFADQLLAFLEDHL